MNKQTLLVCQNIENISFRKGWVSGLRAALKAAYLAGESPAPGIAYLLTWVVISDLGGGDES